MERRTPDAAIAEAMNRVLAAESEAAAAIATAQQEAEALLEVARGQRRQILETARRRASRLHALAQQRLRRSLLELDQAGGAPGTDLKELRALSQEALANVTRRLTAPGHDSD